MDLVVKGKEIKTLSNVPIDTDKFESMRSVLQSHGASIVDAGTEKYYDTSGNITEYKVCSLVFPEGSLRVNHEIVKRSRLFTLYFPDGYVLPGKEIYHGPDLTQTSTLLYLPREQAS